MSLADYCRRARGYYRRLEDSAWEPLRWLGTLTANINRGPDTPAFASSDLLTLAKDARRPKPAGPLPEDARALWKRLDELDKDLLPTN